MASRYLQNVVEPLYKINDTGFGKRTMGKRWTTEDQNEFLESQISDFLKAQRESRVTRFYTALHEEWFIRWPEVDSLFPADPDSPHDIPTPEQDAELQKAIQKRKNVSFPYRQSKAMKLTIL